MKNLKRFWNWVLSWFSQNKVSKKKLESNRLYAVVVKDQINLVNDKKQPTVLPAGKYSLSPASIVGGEKNSVIVDYLVVNGMKQCATLTYWQALLDSGRVELA